MKIYKNIRIHRIKFKFCDLWVKAFKEVYKWKMKSQNMQSSCLLLPLKSAAM